MYVYSDKYFYSKERETDGFGTNPPGRLSVSRLIRNQPCWQQTIRQQVKIRKIFILNDWTANAWSWRKYDAINTAIEDIIKNGFTIYAWSGRALVKLEEDGLSLSMKKSMTPATTSEIIHAAEKIHLSADKIFVLGTCDLNGFLSPDETDEISLDEHEETITLSNFLQSSYNKTKLITWLKQAHPFSKLVVDELDHDGVIQFLRDLCLISMRMSLLGCILN